MGWYIHPRTTQERRRWFADIELISEYPELKLRLSRSAHILTDSYDDIPRGDWEDRCWKRYRNTQYRLKRSKYKSQGTRGIFDTPYVEMHKSPYWHWGFSMRRRGMQRHYPFRVRFKYIKNKTA